MKLKKIIPLILSTVVVGLLGVSIVSFSNLAVPEPNSPQGIASNLFDQLSVAFDNIEKQSVNKTQASSTGSKRAYRNAPSDGAEIIEDEPNDKEELQVSVRGNTYPLRTYNAHSMPNDPNANQWWVQNISLDEAWDVEEGDNPVLLAIVDTGFALNHEEFEGRFFENSGESGATMSEAASDLNCTDQGIPLTRACNNIDDNSDGITDNESGATSSQNVSFLNCTDQGIPLDKSCNRIDDDGNGYIDDVTGWDFINGDASVQAGETNPSDPDASHGTYVAGVAAANRNNNVGLAGVNAEATILPMQALSDTGSGHTLSVARAVTYAAEQGADVISLSLGSELSDEYLQEAILDAIAEGSIVVAASGNDGCNCVSYPANYEEVVAVGASNSSNNPYSFSNYGANLDVLAPGAGFYTARWTAGNQTSGYASDIAGTSLATPVVSGLLATMRSHYETASATELIAAVTENTNRTGITTEHADTRGFGRVEANASIQRLLTPYTPPIMYEYSPVSSGETLGIETTTDDHQVRVYDCDIYGEYGTSPLYFIDPLAGSSYFTSSYAERAAAINDGTSSEFLAHLCVLLPHDTPDTIRSINPLIEFKSSIE